MASLTTTTSTTTKEKSPEEALEVPVDVSEKDVDVCASPRNLSTISWIAVVISLFSALFLFALDQTIVADIQPEIITTFGHVDKLPWVSVAYPLGAIALNLLVYELQVFRSRTRADG